MKTPEEEKIEKEEKDANNKAREEHFPLNQRNSMIEQMADRRDTEVAEEIGVTKEDLAGDQEDDKTDDKAGEDTENKDKTDEIKDDKDTDKPSDDDEEMIDIKVNGNVKKYKKSVVEDHGGVRAFQKELAADEKMRLADDKEKEYQNKLKELDKSGKTDDLSNKDDDLEDGKTDTGDKEKGGKSIREKLADIGHTIQFGSDDSLVDALAELLELKGSGNLSSTQEDVSKDLESEIDRRLAAKEQEKTFNDIGKRFKDDFAPLLDAKYGTTRINGTVDGKPKTIEVPTLQTAVSSEVDRLIAEEDADPYSYETYQKAGKTVAERFNIQIGDSSKETDKDEGLQVDDDVKNKNIKKKKIDNVKGATGTHSDASTEDGGPKTETEMRVQGVKEIKKARGQL